MGFSRLRAALQRWREQLSYKNRYYGQRLYGWWWWRSVNRPHVIDDTYYQLVRELPPGLCGLDLGSGDIRIREDAIAIDAFPYPSIDALCDGSQLPFDDNTFDYVWCNAVLEHVPYPGKVAEEIMRTLKPGGLAVISTPFLEFVHGWPDDYFRYTVQGLRVLFDGLEEVQSGVTAGPGQVLPDILQFYGTGFMDLQERGVLPNLLAIAVGVWLIPLRLLDRVLKRRPFYWKVARGYYYAARKPISLAFPAPQPKPQSLCA